MKDNTSWAEARSVAFILQSGASHTIQLIDLGKADRIDQGNLAFRKALTGEDERTSTPSSLSAENMPSQVVEPPREKVSRMRHLTLDMHRSSVSKRRQAASFGNRSTV
ncbi:MAG TPA: hypothetical protein VFQ30_21680 [Ktedonobacteraceae bacterium]|nr:hypothetical protein [Ktedonobacteraceae bacterium]